MRIFELELTVATSGMLEILCGFFAGTFGLPAQHDPGKCATITVGASQLRFGVDKRGDTHRHHYAFNVPSNQFAAAVAWLRMRAPLIRDAAGRELFYSEDWDADSAYFYDPAGNIGELIARRTLPGADQPFSAASLSCVSEVGVGCMHVQAAADAIQHLTGAPAYHWSPPASIFAPLGDEQGLLILVPTGRIWFPDTGIPAKDTPFRAVVQRADGQRTVIDNGVIN